MTVESEVADAGRPRVLLVDDEASVLAALRRVLETEFDVTAIVGSLRGLTAVQEATVPFHVVVTDLRMPDLSGIGLLQCVRQVSPRTVRVLLTGYADLSAAVAAVNAAEVYRFLTKPCKPHDLIAAVRAGCNRFEAEGGNDREGASAA